jgi:hypothetical protein
VTSPAGTAIAHDSLSQNQYGISSVSYETFLATEADLISAANFLLGRYSRPVLRVSALTTNFDSLSEDQKNALIDLELADVAKIVFTPNNVGNPSEKFGIIIGINHSVGLDRHDITFAFAPVQTNVFIIGDPEFGTIGEDALGVLGY